MVKVLKRTGFYLAVLFMAAFCLFPIYFLISASLQPTDMAYQSPPVLYPKSITFEHYVNVFKSVPLARYFLNSSIVALSGTALALVAGAMIAFAVAILKMKWGYSILNLLIVLGRFPLVILIIPLFQLITTFGLMNNYLALILPYATLNIPLTAWIMSVHMEQMPDALYDAAVIDGANKWQIFYKLIMPLCAPALATVAVLDFVMCWHEFMLALSFMTNSNMYTVTIGLAQISGNYTYQYPWGEILAGTLLVTLPVVLFVLFAQEKIISGLTAGAVKE